MEEDNKKKISKILKEKWKSFFEFDRIFPGNTCCRCGSEAMAAMKKFEGEYELILYVYVCLSCEIIMRPE